MLAALAVSVLVGACSVVGDSAPVAATPSPAVTPSPVPTATVSKSEEQLPLAPVFSISTVDGEEVRLDDVLGTKPIYVLFVTGVDDELDRAQIGRVQSRYTQFAAMGVSVFVIVSDLPENVLLLRDELGLEFPLIADPLNVIASDWQVLDQSGKGKSVPASFVFDAHGTLIARLVAVDPADRPSVEEVLQVIRESLSAGAA